VSPFRKLAIASPARYRCNGCGCQLALSYPRVRGLVNAMLGTSVVYGCLLAASYWPLLAMFGIWLLGVQLAPLKLDNTDKLSARLATAQPNSNV
jgi:hypothetical protein